MYKGIFDSHAHYDDERFNEDRDTFIPSLKENGVENVITIGCDIKTSRNAFNLAQKYDFFYAGIGYHPHEASAFNDKDFAEIKNMLKDPKVVALGEIGLDYHYDFSPRDIQKKVFEIQMAYAEENNIPVIIHSREATRDTLEILSKYNCQGVVHCFSGSDETAKILIKMGYYIGFTGVITFNNARKTVDACKAVPLDRLLLETDCPYMAPVPFRGKRCDSTMIEKTAEKIAEIKGISPKELIDIANKNTKTLFNLN